MKKILNMIVLVTCVAINGIIFGYEWCDYITEWYEVLELVVIVGGVELLGALMWSAIKNLCAKEKKESKE